jgi:DNA-directed RNA polymerase specialized sigma24 family protein
MCRKIIGGRRDIADSSLSLVFSGLLRLEAYGFNAEPPVDREKKRRYFAYLNRVFTNIFITRWYLRKREIENQEQLAHHQSMLSKEDGQRKAREIIEGLLAEMKAIPAYARTYEKIAAVVRHDAQGMPRCDIARELGISRGSVYEYRKVFILFSKRRLNAFQ